MAKISDVTYYLHEYWLDHGDKRFSHMPFMATPWRLYLLLSAYLAFVLYLGPIFMRERKPYPIKPIIRAYNLFMALFNTFLFTQVVLKTNFARDCFGCDKAIQILPDETVFLGWLGFFSRLCDLLDTVFFVLRKKFSHVSFLHVFHHTIVPIMCWYGLKTAYIPTLLFPFVLNFFIHIIMFTYYFLASFRAMKPYLWWKKHLTKMQIIQFVIIFIHSLQKLYYYDCDFPPIVHVQTILSFMFFCLFVSFYMNAYRKRRMSQSVDTKTIDELKAHQA